MWSPPMLTILPLKRYTLLLIDADEAAADAEETTANGDETAGNVDGTTVNIDDILTAEKTRCSWMFSCLCYDNVTGSSFICL